MLKFSYITCYESCTDKLCTLIYCYLNKNSNTEIHGLIPLYTLVILFSVGKLALWEGCVCRCLVKNSSAVVEIEFDRPVCLEMYKEYKDLGRFMLRHGGHTIAAGLVEEVNKSWLYFKKQSCTVFTETWNYHECCFCRFWKQNRKQKKTPQNERPPFGTSSWLSILPCLDRLLMFVYM